MNQDTDILVVGDSPTQAETLRDILEKENYGFFPAKDAAKALELLKERRFGLILSDITMPGMNGYEFCRRVKDDPATKDIPVILLTGLSDPGDIIAVLECGADNFIAKPFEPEHLLSWIKHHLVTLELRKSGGVREELKFYFTGNERSISSDRVHMLDILLSTYENVVQKDQEVKKAQLELERLNSSLEAKVGERTADLSREIKIRTKAEAELRASEEKFKFAQKLGRIGNWELDVEKQAVHWSDEMYALYERDPKLGPPSAEEEARYYSPEQQKILRDHVARAMETGGRQMYEVVVLLSGGKTGEYSVIMETAKDAGGRVVRLFGTVQDITARKEAEKALNESETQYRMLHESSRDAFITLFPPDWSFTLCNPAAVGMFNAADKAGISSRAPWELSPEYQPDGELSSVKARRMIETAMEKGTNFFEWTHKRIGGPDFPATVLLTRIELDGKTGLQATVRDISEQKRTEKEREALREQFLHSQKMEAVGRLAGGIAHDFNNLLTAIEGYAGFLLKSLAPDDKRRDDAAEILKVSENAATLTRQLLVFSRRQILQLRVLDCNAAIRDTQKMLKRLIGEDITLALDLANGTCRIKADAGQVEQIIMNLVVNARDAMPKGGGVTIKTENVELDEGYSRMHVEVRPGPHVMISVTDTGSGIPSEVMPHIFEPFFTTKETGKGTGLGLATVYAIVNQSGGNVYVRSEPGLGTTFTIYLPQATEEVETAAAPVRPKTLRGTETILLVEDDASVRGIALRVLRENGYTLLEAGSPKEAAGLCETNAGKIDLILTDTIMPGMNGYEFYDLISKRWPGLKVIFMSGYTNSELVSARLTNEKLPFLQKPFSADALAIKVREVLDSRKAVRA